jgi:hypothetical protein
MNTFSMLSPRGRTVAVGLTGLMAILLIGGLAVLVPKRLDPELEELPKTERQALYERTLETLETSCTHHAAGPTLSDYCLEQADFIRGFPECQKGCRELVARFEPQPSR